MSPLRRKHPVLLLALLAPLALVLAGCGDDGHDVAGPDDQAFQKLVGTWQASSFEFTSQEDHPESVEVIGLGAEVTVTITPNNRYTLTSALPGEGSETESGDIEVDGDQLVLTADLDGEVERLDYVLSDGDQRLTISFEDDEGFDFDDDGEDDPASVEIVLEKQ